MNVATLDYRLDGVPADLAEHVRNSTRLRDSLLKMQATGIRLVAMPEGWEDLRSGEKSKEAFEVQILGRPGREDDTKSGGWGQCYARVGGQWTLAQISIC